MKSKIDVLVPFINKVQTFNLIGKGAYPYDCIAKDKHPNSLIFEHDGGWIASHQLVKTDKGYYLLKNE